MKAGKQSRRRLVDRCGLLAQELVGSQYGSLKIVSRMTEGSSDRLRVQVKCDRCGETHMALYHNIRKRPDTNACPHCNGRQPVTVPKWLYRRCQSQQDRCNNPRSTSYARYGGRGIQFRFPSPNEAAQWIAENLGIQDRSLEIDRIDNNGHYEPGNLRWVHPVENIGNSRKSTGSREKFIAFRENHPEIRYADATLRRLICSGMTDKQIIERWNIPSCKPKGKYGTFSTLGLYRDLPQTED